MRKLARRATPFVAAIALAVVDIACRPAPADAEAGALEFAVKAAYLSKLGAFVEWPRAAFGSRTSAVKLCVVGEDPFGRLLDQAVNGQTIDGRPIVTERLQAASRKAGCQIVYIAKPDPSSVAEVLRDLRGSPVLTVTDTSVEKGVRGVVNFVVLDGHVRFQIDSHAAAENGLKISSKLLSLAVPTNASS